jgi:2,4-dienoyl-CoA reductase-like NADH-dependent reductase (Old Yellow Enzyme family)
MVTATSLLFSPAKLRDVELKNRVMISPMCQYAASDGVATDWHMVHLGQYALGGAGVVFAEATAVEERGRITHGDLGLWRDDQIGALRGVAAFIRSNGAVPAIQLAHSGRKGSIRRPWEGNGPLDEVDSRNGYPPWETVGPSPLAYEANATIPHVLSGDEIALVVAAWRSAARRAREAEFDVVEVHAAHGYLIHQFLSQMSNTRTDRYGGSLSNRMRLLLEIVDAVRTEWPSSKPVFVRLSVMDDADDGWKIEDAYRVVDALRKCGIDVIDCSSGGISRPGFAIRGRYVPGYQVSLAESVRRATGMKCVAVGLITTGSQAELVLRSGQADLVAIGREALVDPHWAVRVATEMGLDPTYETWPKQYGWWLDRRARSVTPPPT